MFITNLFSPGICLADNKDDDGPGEKDDNQPNHSGGDCFLSFGNFILITTRCKPEKTTVQDKNDSNQAQETEHQLYDIDNG